MGFLDDLFGGSSGKKAANAAADYAAGQTRTGYNQFRGQVGGGYDQADSILSGYEKPGQAAYGMYADSIGANGVEGYGRAKSSFDADPFLAGSDEANNRLLRSQFGKYNAQGMGDSGVSRAALSLTNSQMYDKRVADFRNRLMGLGSQGAQFGQARAGNMVQRGQDIGGSYLGEANQLSNIENGRQQGIYQAKQAGANNIMKAAGMVAGLAAAPFTGGASLAAMGPLSAGGSRMGNALAGAPSNYGQSWDAWTRRS